MSSVTSVSSVTSPFVTVATLEGPRDSDRTCRPREAPAVGAVAAPLPGATSPPAGARSEGTTGGHGLAGALDRIGK